MKEALFCLPEKILLAPFWGNPAFAWNNKPIYENNFPILYKKIKSLQDLFEVGSNTICTKPYLEQKFGIVIKECDFIELKYIIKCSVEKLGLLVKNLPMVQFPSQPLLVNIALLTKKDAVHIIKLLEKKHLD